mmetsp:Transcript_46258/g.119208  ORF Transcript_46258/g.119208 Transcript_46258/m.119208 type:complete len:119 (-) Transcript_46258:177-533(-)
MSNDKESAIAASREPQTREREQGENSLPPCGEEHAASSLSNEKEGDAESFLRQMGGNPDMQSFGPPANWFFSSRTLRPRRTSIVTIGTGRQAQQFRVEEVTDVVSVRPKAPLLFVEKP